MKLNHFFVRPTEKSKPVGRWSLAHDGETILETGSVVEMLRLLIRLGLEIPYVMGPSCFEKEYEVEWTLVRMAGPVRFSSPPRRKNKSRK